VKGGEGHKRATVPSKEDVTEHMIVRVEPQSAAVLRGRYARTLDAPNLIALHHLWNTLKLLMKSPNVVNLV
jgi:hypothetical protein